MKLKFDPNQQYQLDAIDAVIDVFAGQRKLDGTSFGGQEILGFDGQQLSLEVAVARGNILELSNEQLIKNTHVVQERNKLKKSGAIVDKTANENVLAHGMNFSIEMETGTGKTYVYLRTIHELHEQYGWKKFIIVVPSVAIREGVLKNLEITREHFAELYHKPEMNYYVWDSKKTGQAREFATNDTLQIMVITIDASRWKKRTPSSDTSHGRVTAATASHPLRASMTVRSAGAWDRVREIGRAHV